MLFKIFECLGTPNDSIYHGVSKLPEYKLTYPKFKPTGLEKLFPHFND